jgi:hypothetical protein
MRTFESTQLAKQRIGVTGKRWQLGCRLAAVALAETDGNPGDLCVIADKITQEYIREAHIIGHLVQKGF